MKTSTVSVAIATYNEEQNIKKCLDSVVDWVDEIIIVDGQSQDQTVKYAKKYKNTKIISTPNQAMFHLNKQLAIENCHSDWILQLDADEVVDQDLRKEIISILQVKPNLISESGYWIPRKNFFLNRFLTKGGQYPDYTIRFYKNGQGHLSCQSVHEQAVINGNIGHLLGHLLHYADVNFERYLTRNNRYTSLIADELQKKHTPINFVSFLKYFLSLPLLTFFSIYFRHRGFVDGFPGFVFAYYSAISYRSAYIKYYGIQKNL
jgi:glycosyltransferase involved in cell wall biosynthesis